MMTSGKLEWTGVLTREDSDQWADLKISQTLMLRVTTVTLVFLRESCTWSLVRSEFTGDKYRELVSGENSPRGYGAVEYTGNGLPLVYHWAVSVLRDEANATRLKG